MKYSSLINHFLRHSPGRSHRPTRLPRLKIQQYHPSPTTTLRSHTSQQLPTRLKYRCIHTGVVEPFVGRDVKRRVDPSFGEDVDGEEVERIIIKLTLTPTLTCTRTHLLHDKTASFQECVVYIYIFLGSCA